MSDQAAAKPVAFRPLLDLLPGMPAGEVCGPDGCAPADPQQAATRTDEDEVADEGHPRD